MLSVSQLRYERYFEPVFEPLDLALSPGKLLLLRGANGCGKTTLIRLLADIIQPTSGAIELDNATLAYVGHRLAIKDDLSVEENLRFVCHFNGSNANVDGVIRRVGLQRVRGQAARTLSAGQRKRCALARLLLIPADLWLLDEPYSNLDQEGIELVDGIISDHLAGGGACVLATHGAHQPPGVDAQVIEVISGAVA